MTSLQRLKTCMENINWLWWAEKDALAFVVPAIPIHERLFIWIYFGCSFVSNLNDSACFLRFFLFTSIFFYWCSTIDLKSALLHANKMTTFKGSFAGISLFTSSSRNICKRKQIPHEATFFSNTVILQSALSLFYRHLCFQWISSKFCTSYNILNTYNSLQKEKKDEPRNYDFFVFVFYLLLLLLLLVVYW